MKLIILVSILFTLVACKLDSDRELQDFTDPNLRNIQGEWILNCWSSKSAELSFDNGLLSIEVSDYQDSECSMPVNTQTIDVTYTLGGIVPTERGYAAREIDFELTTSTNKDTSLMILNLADIYYMVGDRLYVGVEDDSRPSELDLSKVLRLKTSVTN